ncbi:MAG TPA: hypothetical protein VND88_09625, partial [Candidatus Acidoferrales bacterium]|nr:hypothetical protein [Candidatus Acidoferrales bacterium]
AAAVDRALNDASNAALEATNRLSSAEGLISQLADAELEAAARAEHLKTAQSVNEETTRAAQTAQNEFTRLTAAHAAASLAERLKAGDPCPVCHRVLESAPEIDEHVAESLAASRQRDEICREEADKAGATLALAAAESAAARRDLERARAAVAGALEGVDDVDRLRHRVRTLEDAKTLQIEAQSAARQAVETAAAAESDARVGVERLVTTLANKTKAHDELTADCEAPWVIVGDLGVRASACSWA